MMTDEENKEYEELKSLLYTGTISQCGKRKIIDIIEKQQKEIEELKNADLTSVYLDGVYDGEKKWKDKIKAKIEELEKEEKEMLKGTKGQDRYVIKQEYMYKRSGLQSLLEKGGE